jgi:hypothetical protein
MESGTHKHNLQIDVDVSAAGGGFARLSRVALEIQLTRIAGIILTTGEWVNGLMWRLSTL